MTRALTILAVAVTAYGITGDKPPRTYAVLVGIALLIAAAGRWETDRHGKDADWRREWERRYNR